MPFVMKVHIENGQKRITPLIDHAKPYSVVDSRHFCLEQSNVCMYFKPADKACTTKHSE